MMARVRDRPHRANHAEENRMGSPRHDSWEARAYGSRWVPLGGFEYSHRLTLPPMSFCEDDSENSVEQRRWDDFAALGGTKIGFWGNLHLRGCTKRKASIRWEFPKERRAAQHPCAERTVLRVAQAFAKSCAGFAVRNPRAHRRSTCKVACFFLQLFLSGKEKVDRFLFAKGKIL